MTGTAPEKNTDKNASSGTLVSGITGGIASGKSTVARMFAEGGIPHFDADKMVHHLLQHDRNIIAAMAAAFPEALESVIASEARQSSARSATEELDCHVANAPRNDDIKINRATLAETITHHPEKLRILERILHPAVRAAEEAFIADAKRDGIRAVILDIPLLFETDAHLLCDKIIVTHAPLDHRKARAFTRQGMTEQKWERLLARQLTDHASHPRADSVISTDTSEEATRTLVNNIKNKWNIQ